jgi:hypothetical protein
MTTQGQKNHGDLLPTRLVLISLSCISVTHGLPACMQEQQPAAYARPLAALDLSLAAPSFFFSPPRPTPLLSLAAAFLI